MSVPWYRRRREKGMKRRSIVEEGLKSLLTNLLDTQDSPGDEEEGKNVYQLQYSIVVYNATDWKCKQSGLSWAILEIAS